MQVAVVLVGSRRQQQQEQQQQYQWWQQSQYMYMHVQHVIVFFEHRLAEALLSSSPKQAFVMTGAVYQLHVGLACMQEYGMEKHEKTIYLRDSFGLSQGSSSQGFFSGRSISQVYMFFQFLLSFWYVLACFSQALLGFLMFSVLFPYAFACFS